MAIIGGGDTGDSHTCLVTMGDTDTEEEEGEDALEHGRDLSRGEVDVQKAERVLELRRRVTLAVILVIFIFSIGFIAFSVIVDLKAQKSKLKTFSALGYVHVFVIYCAGLVLLEEIICSEDDAACLSLLCPATMKYDAAAARCEQEGGVAALGVVGNIKQMCREGFVWVEWKERCLRQN